MTWKQLKLLIKEFEAASSCPPGLWRNPAESELAAIVADDFGKFIRSNPQIALDAECPRAISDMWIHTYWTAMQTAA
jgi:hypothetical protein